MFIVLASIAFVSPNALVRVPLRPYAASGKEVLCVHIIMNFIYE